MSTRTATIQRLPIRLGLCYVAATVFVFIFGPLDRLLDNWAAFLGFLAVTMFALCLGFRWAMARPGVGTSLGGWRHVIAFGAAGGYWRADGTLLLGKLLGQLDPHPLVHQLFIEGASSAS